MSAVRLETGTLFVTRGSHTGASWLTDSDIERGKRIMGGYKHDGSKGPKYTRWKERFLDDAQGAGDADYSMAQCLLMRSFWGDIAADLRAPKTKENHDLVSPHV